MASRAKTIGDLIAADASVAIPGDGVVLASDLADGSVTTAKLADANVTIGKIATTVPLGTKNLIINGDMRIDQRLGGVSITPTDGEYTVDRWLFRVSQASKLTAQQVTDAPTGFDYSLKVTSSSAYTVGASDFFECEQRIEGNNVYPLDLGTSDAKTITISFWVKSSLTGTFGGSLANVAFDRSYPFEYTISSANTWEKKTVTVALDTTGTWATDNTIGLRVQFGLGVGNNWAGTAGSWIATGTWSATGATSVVGTSGATWQLTGVQVEVGDTATDYEHRPHDAELIRCMRYYETCYLEWYQVGYSNAFRGGRHFFRVFKRSSPTGSVKSGTFRYALLGVATVSAESNSGLTIGDTNDGFFISHTRQAGGTTPTNGYTYHNETAVTLQFDAEL